MLPAAAPLHPSSACSKGPLWPRVPSWQDNQVPSCHLHVVKPAFPPHPGRREQKKRG